MTQHIAHTGGAFLDGDAQRDSIGYKLRKIMKAKSTLALVLVAPLVILIAGLILYPFCYAIYLSMQNKSETSFVWFRNFEFLFKRDTFWMVVQQSVIFAVSAVIFKALTGLVVA
ncbi:MAG TPA: sugar ABC transporter permease, partial [bacterium]